MQKTVRVVEIGGSGPRRGDVCGSEVYNFQMTQKGEITTLAQLFGFAGSSLASTTDGYVFVVAGDILDDVVTTPQIPWLNKVNLVKHARAIFGDRVIVANDMDVAVLGMAELLGNPSDVMGITLSSGIGMRVLKDGKIVSPCEAGHINLDPSPFAPLCGCGLRGCVESICSGDAAERRVIAEIGIRGIEIPNGIRPCAFLDSEFDKGERWATDIYSMVSNGLGTFLATLLTLYRPQLVVWKGTFATHALPRLEASIRENMRKKLMVPEWEKGMKFVFSPNSINDALIGAWVLFKQIYK